MTLAAISTPTAPPTRTHGATATEMVTPGFDRTLREAAEPAPAAEVPHPAVAPERQAEDDAEVDTQADRQQDAPPQPDAAAGADLNGTAQSEPTAIEVVPGAATAHAAPRAPLVQAAPGHESSAVAPAEPGAGALVEAASQAVAATGPAAPQATAAQAQPGPGAPIAEGPTGPPGLAPPLIPVQAGIEPNAAPAVLPAPASVASAAPAPAPETLPHSAAPQLDPSSVDPNVARVARGLQSALSQQGGTVALRLHPPELGVVRVEVEIDAGAVRARFIAEHESVRTLLTHQLQHLRQALQSQGLAVERLEVQTQTQHADAEAQARGDDTAEGRSRGRHGFFQQQSQGRPGDEASTSRPHSFEQALLDLMA